MTRSADHIVSSRRLGLGLVAGVLAIGATLLCSLAAPPEEDRETYLAQEAFISGDQLRSFVKDDQTVNVLLGNAAVTVGDWKITGRDAVIWVKDRRVGSQTLQDMQIYIEGAFDHPAQVVSPEGVVTKDKTIFITLRHRGALGAMVNHWGQESVEDLGLYTRAVRTRAQEMAPKPPAATQAANEPPLLITTSRPTSRPSATTKPVAPRYQPVFFTADALSSEEMPDPDNPGLKRRVTVAKGHVYLAQGNADSDSFLEIQSDAAVIYSRPGQKAGAASTTTAPSPMGDERIVGAYLEGDVRMHRGDRSMLGDRMFYDFQTGKALLVHPVFRIVQDPRKVPLYIRAQEARQLEAAEGKEGAIVARGREWFMREAEVTTSDFYTPSYSIAAKKLYLEDATLYDDKGMAITPREWRDKLYDTTFKVGGTPILWWPFSSGDAEEGNTAIRQFQIGKNGDMGYGAQIEWNLFNLLGIPRPTGYNATLETDAYTNGFVIGANPKYSRDTYSGFAKLTFIEDTGKSDNFGLDRKDVAAPDNRGRALWRHKQFLPDDWEVQFEVSYLSDRNFLEEYYPGEFWTDKEQETALYVKKQKDNWAVTALAKVRVNDFQTQTEAYPELSGYLVGESLMSDTFTMYSEGHVGLLKFKEDDQPAKSAGIPLNSQDARPQGTGDSNTTARLDTRQEVDYPFSLGPVRLMPNAEGRATYWSDSPEQGGLFRPWGQTGIDALMHVWRVYPDISNRLLDVNRIKHVITPYGSVFVTGSDVSPDELFPFTPDVEQYTQRFSGGRAGVRQLWQTRRGPAEKPTIVDWMRLDVYAAVFTGADTTLPADGRYFFSRPEYSLPRNSVNADYAWHISDATTFLADANYDTDTSRFGRVDAGLSVQRDPRLVYYIGQRFIDALNSNITTGGFTYQIDRKYSLSLFEQYDWDFAGGKNLASSLTVTRKFPRFYVACTFVYDGNTGDVSVMVSVWPEGAPEVRLGGQRMSALQSASSSK